MNQQPIYFPSLNGWRAIAAFTVVWTHIERYKHARGLVAFTGPPLNSFIGGLAVTFFFVLSGFLITYLLLAEKTRSGTIRIKKFLARRALRILPLYFLVLVMGYGISIFVLGDTGPNPWSNGFILNACLLSNLAFALYMIPEILIQIWSIGTEVQFYLLWPFLLKGLDPQKLGLLFLGIIGSWFLGRAIIHETLGSHSLANILIFRTRIDCMAIGGLFALGFFAQGWQQALFRKLNKLITHQGFSLVLGLIFIGLVYLSWRLDAGLYPLFALFFGLVILRGIQKPSRILEAGLMKYLGRISYGIYLLHHFCVYIIYWLFARIPGIPVNGFWSEFMRFIPACLLTVLAATGTYFLLEKKFLFARDRRIQTSGAGL